MRFYIWYVTRHPRGVYNEGNFYTHPGTVDEAGKLNLDALPQNMPLVECGPACPCGLSCSNRVTQRGLKYVKHLTMLIVGSRYMSNLATRSVWEHFTTVPRYWRKGHSYASTQANISRPQRPMRDGQRFTRREGREIIS